MFYLIRMLLCIILFIVIFNVINKNKSIKKKTKYFISGMICIGIYIISYFVILENLFITFDNLEEAFKYIKGDSLNYILEVPGLKSSLVIDENEHNMVFSKNETGWKLTSPLNVKKYFGVIINGDNLENLEDIIDVYIFEYDNEDTYIVISALNQELEITDLNNTKYTLVNNNKENYYKYYAYLGNFDINYTFEINGKSYVLKNIIS